MRRKNGKNKKIQPEQQTQTPETLTPEQELVAPEVEEEQVVPVHLESTDFLSDVEPEEFVAAAQIEQEEPSEAEQSEEQQQPVEMLIVSSEDEVPAEKSDSESESESEKEDEAVDQAALKTETAAIVSEKAAQELEAKKVAETAAVAALAASVENITLDVVQDPISIEREAYIKEMTHPTRLADKSRLAKALRLTKGQLEAVEEYVQSVAHARPEKGTSLSAQLRLSEQEIQAMDEKIAKHEGERKEAAAKALSKNNATAKVEAPIESKADMVRAAVLEKFKALKLQTYKEELAKDFSEKAELQAASAQIMEAYANEHFKPTPVVKSSGWFRSESEEDYQKRKTASELAERKAFIAANREVVLLDALKAAIIHDPEAVPEGIKVVTEEQRLQEYIREFYSGLQAQRYRELRIMHAERVQDRSNAVRAPLPEKHISNDLPGLDISLKASSNAALVFTRYRRERVESTPTIEQVQKWQEAVRQSMIMNKAAGDMNNVNTQGLEHCKKPVEVVSFKERVVPVVVERSEQELTVKQRKRLVMESETGNFVIPEKLEALFTKPTRKFKPKA